MSLPSLDSILRWIHHFAAQSGYRDVFLSAALIAGSLLAGHLHARRLKRKPMSVEERRQDQTVFRNSLLLATILALGFVWGGEIRSLILSLAAIAAAIMIVSKELVSCVYGGFLFTFSRLAKIGDSIEVGPHKGELLDHNWFSFTLLEHADTHFYSGKTIKVPNSLLLSTPLSNLSQGGAYRFCTIVFHARHEHASAALACARRAAEEVCAPWLDRARSSVAALQGLHMSQVPDAAPQISMVSLDKDSLAISLRIAAPAGQRAATQAEVSRRFFEGFEAALRDEREAERVRAASERQALFAPVPTPPPAAQDPASQPPATLGASTQGASA